MPADTKRAKSEASLALEDALGRLDPVDRSILRMRCHDELSVPEIARVLILGPPSGLYPRLKKIRADLRNVLEAAGIRGIDL
jgi:DNA-directed RNA polymerase specialized sigma24 family protein